MEQVWLLLEEVCAGQRRMLDLLELHLQVVVIVVNHLKWVQELNSRHLQEQEDKTSHQAQESTFYLKVCDRVMSFSCFARWYKLIIPALSWKQERNSSCYVFEDYECTTPCQIPATYPGCCPTFPSSIPTLTISRPQHLCFDSTRGFCPSLLSSQLQV